MSAPVSAAASASAPATATGSATGPLAAARRLVGLVQLLVVASAALSTAQSLALNGPGGPAWWWGSSLALAGACVAAMVLAVVRGGSPIPPAAAVAAVSALALLSGMVLAQRGLVRPPVVGAPPSWVVHLALVGVTGLAVVARRWAPGPGLVLLAGGAVAVVAWRSDAAFWPARSPGAGFVDAGFVLVTTLTMHGIMRAVDQVGGQLITARAAAEEASRAQLRAGADEADRHRWEALVHDEVLSALAAVRSAPPDQPRAATAGAAGRALAALRADPPVDDVPPVVLRHLLDAAVRSEHPAALVRLEAAGDRTGGAGPADRRCAQAGGAPVPAPVAAAVVDAVVEVVRNTAAHAGPGARAVVSGDLCGDLVDVTVRDDGRGFDPDGVAPYRLGLRLSVLERLGGVGGCAHVTSSDGGGTSVALHWPATSAHPPTARPPAPRPPAPRPPGPRPPEPRPPGPSSPGSPRRVPRAPLTPVASVVGVLRSAAAGARSGADGAGADGSRP